MIIAAALGNLFAGMVQPYDGKDWDVNYHYGDQRELVHWVVGKGSAIKYPLIWYTLAPFTENDGWYETRSRIILLQSTIESWFNTERQKTSYSLMLDPLSKQVRQKLLSSPYVQIYGDTHSKFKMKDQPLHGIGDDSFNLKDFGKTGSGDANESISPDFVDTRIIEINFRIRANCIK